MAVAGEASVGAWNHAATPATGATASIDAPETAAVEAALRATGWKLTHILVTHHHADHTDGIPALKQKHGCRVIAPAEVSSRYPFVDDTVKEGDKVVRLIVTCICGERVEIECLYSAGR